MRGWKNYALLSLSLASALAVAGCDEEPASPAQEGALDQGVEPDLAVEDDAMVPDAAVVSCDPEEGALFGQTYIDTDESTLSSYAGAMDVADEAWAGTVHVIGPDGPIEVSRCADGRYTTPPLPAGSYLAWPERAVDDTRCTSRNCVGRFAEAVADGAAKVVTFGDSIPVVGDAPMFPTRLVTLFEGLADIDSVNVAVAGSTSTEWLPGTRHFERRLAPAVVDADLVIVSIGGNDILGYVRDPALLQDIPAAVEGARALVVEIVGNVMTTVDAIRAVNPDVDIAYCLYVDYAQARGNRLWALAGNLLGQETIQGIFELARASFPDDDPRLLMVDLFAASDGMDVDALLYDALHFNDAGQSLYAEEVFMAIGGVLVGSNPLGATGRSPLGLNKDFALAP